MSVNEQGEGEPVARGSPLAGALDAFAVPNLPPEFADKVLAAAQARDPATLAPLPPLRRSGGGGARGWRLGRRIAIGVVGFGALASAAAATGMLERVGLPVPSPEKVWASITGKEKVPATAAATSPDPASAPPADPAPAALAPVRIVGPIDTPEELGEAFRRIDEVRQGRVEARRLRIEERIAAEKERRAAAGLPLPTPEEEARVRARIEEVRSRREGLLDERIEARREELRQRVEAGEALTREDIVRPMRDDAQMPERRERLERLRQMSPEQRREAFRQLPPEQRRELMEAWRKRREERLRQTGPAEADALDPALEAQETPGSPSQTDTPSAEPPR
ncbi:hypothetical protein [Erythrobacter dokdonensis]|uniref:Uncharacterized protein n=1 Tax=Erythrobacter dokdonensis DSW-74 TaxID=1300349 RepID=A0A1A7BL45_9SPHN|nr:hypothetical protein [Erythrobacter dokdonensis]OBV11885.1 hypothetical protein I603_0016 [Erythrobacter dokdonensis DSW-74]